MASQQFKSLHKNATNVADGEYIIVNNSDTLVVQVSGTGSPVFQINFTGSLDGINYFPISGTAMGNFSSFITSISQVGVGIEFDVSALLYVKCPIVSITGGSVSVLGNAVI
jgi:hypothetical protein